MKNNKKLSRGMTLVEVIIAMTIFSVMAAAIFTVIAHANKTADRAKMRDVELSTQTNIIGRIGQNNNAITQLNQVKPNGYADEYDVVFNIPPAAGVTDTQKTVGDVKVYETDEGAFENDFDFKLKTVTQTSAFTGLTLSSADLNENEYLLKFKNETNESLLIQFNLTDGRVFQGANQQYISTLNYYSKTVPAGASVDIGYFDQAKTGLEGITTTVIGLASNSVQSFSYTTANFNATLRTCEVTASLVSGDPKPKLSRHYITS